MAQIMMYYAALTVMARASLGAFQCPELQNQALIPDPRDCRKYYHCLPGGRVFAMQCPNGLVFDTRQKVCIWDSTAKSCAPDTELTPPEQQQTPHSSKVSHSKGDELRPKGSKVSGPEQTNKPKISPSKARVDAEPKATQVKRKSLPTAGATSTTHATPKPTARQPHSTETESSRAKSEGAGSVQEKHLSAGVEATNKIPARSNVETASDIQSRPTDTPLSVTTTTANTKMGDHSSAVTNMPLPSLESEKPEMENASSGSRVVFKEADMGAHSVQKRSPEDKGLGNYVSDDIRCPSGYAYMPDPSNCATFYHCYNWQPMKKMCPPGLFFDHQTFVCNWPHNVNCIEGYRAKTLYSFNHFRRDRNGARALTFSSEPTARPLKDSAEKTPKPARAAPTSSTKLTTATELRTITTEPRATSTPSTQAPTQPLTSSSDSVNTDSARALSEGLGSVSMTTTEEIRPSVPRGQTLRLATGDDVTEKPRDPSFSQKRENADEDSNNPSKSIEQTASTTAWGPTSDVSHDVNSVQSELYSNNNDLKMNPDAREVSKSVTSVETTNAMKNADSDPAGLQTVVPHSVSEGITSGAHILLTSASNLHDTSSHANDTQAAEVEQRTSGASDTSPPQSPHSPPVSSAADTTTAATPPASSGTAHNSSTPPSVMAARGPVVAVSGRHAAPVSAYHRGSRLRARTLLPRQQQPVSPFTRPSMAASALRTPPSQEFHGYDDVSIEKFMIKLLNDAMRSRHVVSRDVSGSTTSGDVTPPGLTESPRAQRNETTGDKPAPAVSDAADDERKETESNAGRAEDDEKIDDVDEEDADVQEETAPSTLFFLLPGSGLDFGTSTIRQDMRVSGTSHVDAQTYRQALELPSDDQMFFKKTASFPFAARDADNLVVVKDVQDKEKDESHGKQKLEDATVKPDDQVMIGSEVKAALSDTMSDELLLQVGHARSSIYSGLGDEVDLSGDGESPEVMNLIPKIQAFSGISALEGQANSSTDHLNNETDTGPAVSMTTENASTATHDDAVTTSTTPAAVTSQQETTVASQQETTVASQQETTVASQQETTVASQQETTVASQQETDSGSSHTADDLSRILASDDNQTNKAASKISAFDDVMKSQLSAQTEHADTNTTDTAELPSVTQAATAGSTSVLNADDTQTAVNGTSPLFTPSDTPDTASNDSTTPTSSTTFSPSVTTSGFSSSPSPPIGNASISEVASGKETNSNSSLTQPSSTADTANVTQAQSYTTSLSNTTVSRSQTYATSLSDIINGTQTHSQSTLSSGTPVTMSLVSSTALSGQPSNTSTESSTVPADKHSNTWPTDHASAAAADINTSQSSRNTSSASAENSSTPPADVTAIRAEDASNAAFSESTQRAEVFKAKDVTGRPDETTELGDERAVIVTDKLTTHDNTSLDDVSAVPKEGEGNETFARLTDSSSAVSGIAVLFRSSALELTDNETARSFENNSSQAVTTSDNTTTTPTTSLLIDSSSPSSAVIAQNISSDINAASEFLVEADVKLMSDDVTNLETSTSVWRLAEGTADVRSHEGQGVASEATDEADNNETLAHNLTEPRSGEETHSVTGQSDNEVTHNMTTPRLQDASVRSSVLVISMEPSYSDPKVESQATEGHPAEDAIQRVHATEVAQMKNVSHHDDVNSSLTDVSKSASIQGSADTVNANSTANFTEEIIRENDEERNGSATVDHLPVVYLSQDTLVSSSENELYGSKGDNTSELASEESSLLSEEQSALSNAVMVQQVHEVSNHSHLTTASSEWASIQTNATSLSLQSDESGMAAVADGSGNDIREGAEAVVVPDAASQDQAAQQENASKSMREADVVTSVNSEFSEAPSAQDAGTRPSGAQTNAGAHAQDDSSIASSSGSPDLSDKTSGSSAEETSEEGKTDDVASADTDRDDAHNDVIADNASRPDATGRDVAPEAEGGGSKRSFVSLTDLITWYLKHWRNYTRWRQEHTTLSSPTSGQ